MRIVGLTFDDPPAQEAYTCPVCGKVYKSAKGMADHWKKEHPDYLEEDHLDDHLKKEQE